MLNIVRPADHSVAEACNFLNHLPDPPSQDPRPASDDQHPEFGNPDIVESTLKVKAIKKRGRTRTRRGGDEESKEEEKKGPTDTLLAARIKG